MMLTGVRRKPCNVEKVETSTALHACRTIPSTQQNNSDHACATLCMVPVDAIDGGGRCAAIQKRQRGSRIAGCADGCAGRPAVGSFRQAPHGTLSSEQSAAADAAAGLAGKAGAAMTGLAGYESFGAGTCGILRMSRAMRESFRALSPSFLRCSGDRPRVPQSHSNQVVAQRLTTFARR